MSQENLMMMKDDYSDASKPTSSSEQSSQEKTFEASATTGDIPSFGWSAYAERVNGRFAMIGFIAILLIEAISQETFLKWSGLIH